MRWPSDVELDYSETVLYFPNQEGSLLPLHYSISSPQVFMDELNKKFPEVERATKSCKHKRVSKPTISPSKRPLTSTSFKAWFKIFVVKLESWKAPLWSLCWFLSTQRGGATWRCSLLSQFPWSTLNPTPQSSVSWSVSGRNSGCWLWPDRNTWSNTSKRSKRFMHFYFIYSPPKKIFLSNPLLVY